MRLDDVDHKIIARLIENGRESFAALGQRIGLSTAATKRRVDRLRHDGVIRRFTVEIEPARWAGTSRPSSSSTARAGCRRTGCARWSRTIPEVVEAYTVTGEADGILLVRAADAAHLEKVLGTIRNHPGVSRTRSAIVLSHL